MRMSAQFVMWFLWNQFLEASQTEKYQLINGKCKLGSDDPVTLGDCLLLF